MLTRTAVPLWQVLKPRLQFLLELGGASAGSGSGSEEGEGGGMSSDGEGLPPYDATNGVGVGRGASRLSLADRRQRVVAAVARSPSLLVVDSAVIQSRADYLVERWDEWEMPLARC